MSETDPNAILQQAEAFRQDYARVRAEVAKMIVGHDEIVDGVLTCLFVGGHALLEGVPGLGKTLLIRSLSEALSLNFSRIQFTPDLMPADITGTTIVVETQRDDGTTARDFQFRKGPVFAQIVLADEINRTLRPKPRPLCSKRCRKSQVTVGGTTYAIRCPIRSS